MRTDTGLAQTHYWRLRPDKQARSRLFAHTALPLSGDAGVRRVGYRLEWPLKVGVTPAGEAASC